MNILAGIDPFDSAASELQLHHLQHNRQVMEKYLKKSEEHPIVAKTPAV